MDGVPHVTQEPIQPGASFTYEFVARTPGSHMYHSHHNATDQVGRGLLGAFIVEPRDPAQRYDRLTYLDVLARDLRVMDASAISLARENHIPILVFSIQEHGAFADVLAGRGKFTIITDKD